MSKMDEQMLLELLSLRAVVNSIGAYIFSKDTQGRYTYANQLTCELFGMSLESIIGRQDTEFFELTISNDILKNDRRVLEGGETVVTEEQNMVKLSGELHYYQTVKTPVRDQMGRIVGMCGISTDITESKKLKAALERQAHYDFLTGMYNRGRFIELASGEIERASQNASPLSLLMLDVDHFKTINDTYGHRAGDQVLVSLAQVCRETLREVDIAGRLGGEEFAFVLPGTPLEKAQRVAERLRLALAATPVPIAGRDEALLLTASIGISALSEECADIDALLNRADRGLYCAKAAGRNQVCLA